jgi:D-beta-D-heptose 7-phosphate kinase/D-beta-D-heptose 1-phosphate adenosyltransferase
MIYLVSLYAQINIHMKKIVLVTGGFDPLHSGHIAYFEEARKLGDVLVVGVNSDAWLQRKKGRSFMPLLERTNIIRKLECVDFVIDFDDSDGSARHALWMVRQSYPQDQIIFANGGDRTDQNIPEMDFKDSNTKFVFGVGGFNKMNSSSWILEEWRAPKTDRVWGYYRVLHEPNRNVKLKELTVDPGQRLSMQRHSRRNEFWFVSEGEATVYTVNPVNTDIELLGVYNQYQSLYIREGTWHQLVNENGQPLKLIEIQYGDACIEEDIERRL